MGRRPAPTPEREVPAEGGDAQRPPRPPAGRGDARPGMPRPNPAMMPKSPAAFGGGPGARNAGPGRGGPGGPGGPGVPVVPVLRVAAGAGAGAPGARPSRRLRPQRRWPPGPGSRWSWPDPGCLRASGWSVASRSQVEARSSSRVRADGGPDDRWRARPQGQRRDRSPGPRCVADRLRREDRRRRRRAGADAVLARRDGHGDRVGQRRDPRADRRGAQLRRPDRLARGRGPRAARVLRPRVR